MTSEERKQLLEAIEQVDQSENPTEQQREKVRLALALLSAEAGGIAPVTIAEVQQKMKTALADGEACMVDC